MRQPRLSALLAAIALAIAPASQIATAPAARADIRDLLPFGRAHRVAELLPLVVAITTHKVAEDGRASESFGSGFIIDPSGYIATNRHVIVDSTDITVTLQDGTAMPAKLVGAASHIDIALLKVEPKKPLPAVKWGDSSHVRIGDQVLVIGNPLGIGETVSSGIVGALNRDILMGPYDDFIQTDAAINHGNSGGPMFNLRGEVIGINTALFSPNAAGGSVGLGFAIPGNDAQYVLAQLRQYGRTRPGWLGAETQEVTPDIADALGLPPHGTIISGLDKDGPAARAKLQDGDVILRFGRETPRDMRALSRLIEQATGSTVQLTIWRDGQEMTVPVTITEWIEQAPAEAPKKSDAAAKPAVAQPSDLGLHTMPMTDAARAQYKLPADQSGVLVADIAPNTAASGHGLKPGEVILRVQKSAVATPADVLKQFDDARHQDRHHVVLLVQGEDGVRWVALPLG